MVLEASGTLKQLWEGLRELNQASSSIQFLFPGMVYKVLK